MKTFAYVRAADVDTALQSITSEPRAKFLAGGTNLVDLMREGIERPETVIDISRLPLDEIEELADGRLRIGALMRNSRLAAHPLIRTRYPMLSQAILDGASGQLRNMATVGGNLLQRTRCLYFYDEASACNKREPGAGCAALEGFNRGNAVLGTSDHCVATHPSDMAVALAALDATVEVKSTRGTRNIALTDFHRLPGATPHLETELDADELITAVELPVLAVAANSRYRKVRDRASFAFADFCASNGVTRSMGRRATCFDNAVSESFFATYKKELIHTRPWNNLTEVRQHTFLWIEGYYNRRRRHSTLGYLTPLEYELGFRKLTDLAA